jgi:hypothetical protein
VKEQTRRRFVEEQTRRRLCKIKQEEDCARTNNKKICGFLK